MADPIVLGTDGSDASIRALTDGLAVVRPGDITLVTVVDAPDSMLLTGTGFAGGTLTEDEYDQHEQQVVAEGHRVIEAAKAALGLDRVDTVVLRGDAGQAICDFAVDQQASVIVVGTWGNGGIKRAILGSVADHVVRNAPCPVVVVSNPE